MSEAVVFGECVWWFVDGKQRSLRVSGEKEGKMIRSARCVTIQVGH